MRINVGMIHLLMLHVMNDISVRIKSKSMLELKYIDAKERVISVLETFINRC